MSAQPELTVSTPEMREILLEFSKVKESSDMVRKGIFARYNEFTKNLESRYNDLQKEVVELRQVVQSIKT